MTEQTDNKSKVWGENERLELAAQLDAQLDEYINSLEKKQYTEGWPEDRWQEEMEKHPFFMKKSPEPGEELSPLMQGLQQLKYDENENTPEELANNYKEDGNYNYKYKNYRLAIFSYTEGIKTKCKDNELMAQLYNNRAAAHFMLQNYRSSLNDCKTALKLKNPYNKALSRAALCAFKIKRYMECIELCDQYLEQCPADKEILNLRSQATTEKKRLERDSRRRQALEKKQELEEERLIQTIQSRGINLEQYKGKKTLELKDLEPQVPQLAQSRVHLDNDNRLVWPVIMLYPETRQAEFIQKFHEDTTLLEQLEVIFEDPPEWDEGRRYQPNNVNVYFETEDKSQVHKVDTRQRLGEILSNPRYVIKAGTPSFMILIASSEAEKRFLANY
ncbi:tetratricopeptide repeat protein 4 isoform X2 [Cephus cinctus]|nr:tetratricopeptide repeat protein 4 isoform X2 [Cephus cinctus]XP_015606706.1 tetratricopeptide repeat protein 4 isoform X2 [Cephus cinctus]